MNPIERPLRSRARRLLFLRVALYPPNIFAAHGHSPPDWRLRRVLLILYIIWHINRETMGQGQSAPSGVPASAAASAPPAPKNSSKPATPVNGAAAPAPNVLGGQSGGRSRRNRNRKNKSSRKNRR